MSPETALSFLMLALSMRLARWERIDLRTAHRAKLSRVLAGFAALLMLGSMKAPILLSAGLCMLAAVVILQAHGRFLFARRVLLMVSLICCAWLVLANLYAVHGRISFELTSDPISAMVLLGLTLSLCLAETRNGLIPLSLTTVLGERDSVKLLVAALLVPLLLGYLRLRFEQAFHYNANLLLCLHVLGTLLVMAVLLMSIMDRAKDRIQEQRRLQAELESTEQMLRSLLEKGSEFYLTLNLAGRILTANENAKRYLGLPDLNKTVICIEDLILNESHEKMKRLPETLLGGVSGHAVLQFRLQDGEAMPLYVTAACRIRNGAPTEIVLVGRSLPLGLRTPQSSRVLLASA
jgi:PAS domain-containing protein